MAKVFGYITYSFKDKDPIIDELRTIQQDVDMSYKDISKFSGVSVGTIRGWWHGATRRPQSATIEAVARAMGYERRLVKMKKG